MVGREIGVMTQKLYGRGAQNPGHHGNQQTTGITPAGLRIKEIYWKDVGEHIEFPRGFEKHTQKISRNRRTLVGQEHSEIMPLLLC